MEAANKKLMFLATMPYKSGVAVAVFGAVGTYAVACQKDELDREAEKGIFRSTLSWPLDVVCWKQGPKTPS